MIIAWMIYATLLAAASGAAAYALERAARVLGRSTRFVWVAALGFSVLWPLWRLASTLPRPAEEQTAVSRAFLPAVVVAARRDMSAAFIGHLTMIGAGVSAALVTLWLASSAVLLLRLVFGLRALARRKRGWIVRIVDGVRVLVAPDAGPAVVGVRGPEIVIPEWVLTLEPNLRALVLRHELEHVRARDTAPRLLGAVLPALFPWNPALWWQASRLSLALEVDCDARVLRDGSRRDRYGLLLLAIAQRQSQTRFAPALSEPTSQLERRIIVMQHSQPRRPKFVALTLAGGGAAALLLACSMPSPNAPASGDAKSVQGASGRMLRDTALYGKLITPTVDGAQSRAPAASPTFAGAGPFRDFQVEKQVTPVPGSGRPPRYPDALRKRGVEGMVVAQFVVDATGHPEMSTFKVLKSDHRLFTSAVRSALASMRFTPAEVGGRPVKQIVQVPFQFSLHPDTTGARNTSKQIHP